MKKLVFAATVLAAATAISAPAMANEGRAEVRGGVLFGSGAEEAVGGMAVGYDWSIGDTVFYGVEASADKIFASGLDFSLGVSTRLGANVSEQLKAYIAGGYSSKPCNTCVDSYSSGAGVQYEVAENVYVKGEYRHFFTTGGFDDLDAVLVGVGFAM